jgi:hypothetical protein
VRKALRVLGVLVLLALVGLFVDRQLHVPPPPPSAAEIEALVKQRDALTDEVRAAVVASGEKSLGQAPPAGILIGVPTAFLESIVKQVVTGLFSETTLTLRNLRVHKEGDVKAKVVFRKKTFGEYVLDVLVLETKGVLKPKEPDLSFGQNRIALALPVRLASGEGRAVLGLSWDSKGLAASTVCGDTEVKRVVTGRVVPQDYKVNGSFGFKADESAILLTPDFGELAVRIFVEPTEQAWGVVDSVIAEQNGMCQDVLRKIDLKEILTKLLGKGFNVKIPKKIFKPIRLPAGIRQSLDLQGVRLDLTVKTTGLVVDEDRLWYGADLQAHKAAKTQARQ